MKSLWRDVRLGFRRIARNPLFSIIAIVTLAIGIGPSSAIFSVINGVLLRSLPYSEPSDLVMIWSRFSGMGKLQPNLSTPEMVDIREQAESFEKVGAWGYGMSELSGRGNPVRLQTGWLSSNLLDILGHRPELGRSFLPEEHIRGNDRVALLNYEFWQRDLGADRSVIGETVMVDREPYTIVGVMSPDFQLPLDYQWAGKTALFLPLLDPTPESRRQSRYLYLVGRLGKGSTLAEAKAESEVVAGRFRQEYPDSYPESGWKLEVRSVQEEVVGDLQRPMWILIGTMALVLLIVGANLANLYVARAASRRSELALCTALGAGRRRLVREMLVESIVLALLGGALGGLLGAWGIRVLIGLTPGNIPRLDEVSFGLTEILFTLLLSLLIGILLGWVTAAQGTRVDLQSSLQGASQRSAGSKLQGRLRRLAVVGEMGIAMILLVGAGLLIRSFQNLMDFDIGFNRDDLVSVNFQLPEVRYPEEHQVLAFYDGLFRQLDAMPEVRAAGGVGYLPFHITPPLRTFEIEGRSTAPGEPSPSAGLQSVTHDYFQTMEIPLLRGRVLTGADRGDSVAVAVLNETAAGRYWPDEEPVERRFRLTDPEDPDAERPWVTIVGVVGDVRQTGIQSELQPQIFLPYSQMVTSAQELRRYMTAVTRTPDAAGFFDSLKQVVWKLDSELPLGGTTMESRFEQSVARPQFAMLLLTILGSLALLLAAVGLYGVISYSVILRRHETGIRMALGAGRSKVLKLVVGEAMLLAVGGLLIGSVVAFWLSGLLEGLLFEVPAADLSTYVGVALVLAAIALVASLLPAWRASRVQPVQVLRYE